MKPSRFLSLAALVCAATLSTPALCADPSPAELAAANQAFKRGTAAVDAGDFEKARIYFVQAYTVSSEPNALYSLALAEKKTGHSLDALKHFRAYVADSRPNASAYKVKAREHILDLQRVTARLRIEAPKGRVIRVDQTDVGEEQARAGVDVLPGKHHLEAGTEQRDVDVTASQELPVVFTDPLPNAAPAPLTQRVVPPPPPPEPVPPPEQEPSGLACPHSGACLGTTIGLGVLGAGGLVAGALFASSANGAASDASGFVGTQTVSCAGRASSDCQQIAKLKDDYDSRSTLSAVSYVAGSVLLVGSAAVFLLWPKSSPPPRAQAAPLITRDFAGVALRGSF